MSVKALNPVTMRARRRRERERGAWFRAGVEQALRKADNPQTHRISDEAVKAAWRRQRAGLEQRCSRLRVEE